MPGDIETLKRIRSSLYDDVWKEYRSYRQDIWLPHVRSAYEPEVDETLAAFANRYKVKSPELEFDLSQRVARLTQNEVKVDVVALESGERHQKTAEEIRIWDAAWLARFNFGTWLQEHWANSISPMGIAYFRLLWTQPEEPEIESEPDEAMRSYERKREQAYLEANETCFKLIFCNPLTMAHGPDLGDPKHIVQDQVLSYYEAGKLTKRSTGEHVGLTSDGKKIAFFAAGQPPDSQSKTLGQKTVHFVVWEYEDEETGKWWHVEYVFPGSGSLKDGEELDRFEIPFGRSSYFICGAGTENVTEVDPHLRYRPPMFPLISVIHELNFWNSVLGAIALEQASGVYAYVDIPPTVTGEQLSALGELGTVEEYGGQRRLAIRKPEAGSNEIPAVTGEVKPWPSVDVAQIIARIQMLEVEKERFATNRLSVGNATPSELSNGQVSALLSQMQAADIPLNRDLNKFCRMVEEILRAINAFPGYFDDGVDEEGKQKLYPVVTTSDLPVSRGSVDDGETVVMTANKLKLRHGINVYTDAKTAQEKALEKQQADYDYDRKAITTVQWLKQRGNADPEHQLEELNKEGSLVRAQQLLAPDFDREMSNLVSLMVGVPMGTAAMLGSPSQVEGSGNQPVGVESAPNTPTQQMSAPMIPGAMGGTG